MGSPRDIRRLTLMALYQLDARAGLDTELIRSSLDDTDTFLSEGLSFADPSSKLSERDRDRAFEAAVGAFANIEVADAEFNALSEEWSVHRMPAVDRAILRLAHYEMTMIEDPKPKASVNEAIELAKQFSTAESPGFVNGLLDKVLKRVLAQADQAAAGSAEH
ncbi:MAG: transcription antitermination factor NusB [Phycisphaerales bacterium]|nr:transcription antitermination factor NusB [Phycisphaerales bacterium]